MKLTTLLRKERNKRLLTTAEMGELLGFSQGTYSAYENGSKKPSVKTKRKIAEKLGLTYEEIGLCQ